MSKPSTTVYPMDPFKVHFFSIPYASTITEVIPPTLELMGYADDHLIRNHLNLETPMATLNLIPSPSWRIQCLKLASGWMKSDSNLTSPKPISSTLAANINSKKCTFDKININSETIQRSDTVKYLGGHLDQNLNFRKHVITKCKAAMINIWKIRLIRKFLTRDICHQLTLSLAISHLDYSNAILIGCPDTTLGLMQKVQNTAARMVLNKHRSHSATECLKQLHWLPIKSRINYKVLTIVFKCKHGMAPKYLQDLLEAKKNQRHGLKSNNKQLLKCQQQPEKHLQADCSVSRDPSCGMICPTAFEQYHHMQSLKSNSKHTYLISNINKPNYTIVKHIQ